MSGVSNQVRSEQVDATVNYITRKDEPLYSYFFMEPPPGKAASNEVHEPHAVSIANMNDMEQVPTLDVEGFMRATLNTKVGDIYDGGEREAVYYPEVTELVKNITGACEVRIFEPFLRGPEAQRRAPGSITAPAAAAHVDFTIENGPHWYNNLLGEDADKYRGHDFAIINVWRPITGPLRDHPLALCDARTVSPDDLMKSLSITRVGSDGLHSEKGEIMETEVYSVAWNPAHRWYYFPDMMPNDVVLLKNYDSRPDVARFVPHCAFDDPNTPADALARASIEVRTLTIW